MWNPCNCTNQHNYLLSIFCSVFLQFFPFPTLVALLQISFTFCSPSLAPFLTFSTTSSTCLPGLKRLTQMQCSPSFEGNRQNNYTTTCWHQLHVHVHAQWKYRVFQEEKCLSYPPDCMDRDNESPTCMDNL